MSDLSRLQAEELTGGNTGRGRPGVSRYAHLPVTLVAVERAS